MFSVRTLIFLMTNYNLIMYFVSITISHFSFFIVCCSFFCLSFYYKTDKGQVARSLRDATIKSFFIFLKLSNYDFIASWFFVEDPDFGLMDEALIE